MAVRVARLKYAHNDPIFFYAKGLEVISAGNLEAPRLLAEGKVDLAFVPITLAAELGLPVVPRLAVYSMGPVISARIFRGRGASGYAAVNDTTVNARAAAKLLGVSFRRVEDVERALDEYAGVLVIGDGALRLVDRGVPYEVDVGELWQERVGAPLVYAMLAARLGLATGAVERAVKELENSLSAFYENPDPVVKRTAARLGIRELLVAEYFARVKYFVNSEVLRGLELEVDLLGLPSLRPLPYQPWS